MSSVAQSKIQRPKKNDRLKVQMVDTLDRKNRCRRDDLKRTGVEACSKREKTWRRDEKRGVRRLPG
jgi:hypothetical protein